MTDQKLLAGWFPAFDVIVEKYGWISGTVFGFIWRECLNNGGICKTSKRSIAHELHIKRQDIVDCINVLVEDGYLEETYALPIFDANQVVTCWKLGKIKVSLNMGLQTYEH